MNNTINSVFDETSGAVSAASAGTSDNSSRKRKRTVAVASSAIPAIKHAFLKDRITPITIFPIPPGYRLPHSLLVKLCAEFNNEIARGTTFAFTDPMSLPQFQAYWLTHYAAVMLRGRDDPLREGRDWEADCIGTFSLCSRYPGRSAHVCTGNFLVCENFRGKGAGKSLVNAFLDYSTKLGYSSALFDLVYETNETILHILDNLGFKRVGTIKAAGHLLNHAEPVDSVILSRDLAEEEDFQSNERFEKIRYYLEKGKYPPSATRPEKSRLRSAATHYKLVGDKLMLKDKEVVSDPQKQYEIARDMHKVSHGGINKTTAQIADKYHWIQIKKTVGQVLKNCVECAQNARPPVVKAISSSEKSTDTPEARDIVTAPGISLDNNANDNENQIGDAEAEDDEDAIIPISHIQSEPMLEIATQMTHAQAVMMDHSHRAMKSPPGHHHHQLAQSIRSQHDAMQLSQRTQGVVVVDASMTVGGGGGAAGLNVGVLNSDLLDDIAVDPAMMDGVVVNHHHHVHQAPHAHLAQQQHGGGHDNVNAMDEINMMDNFDDIQEPFDEDDLLQQGLMGPAGSEGGMLDDEQRRRHHAHATALAAEAVLNGGGGSGMGQGGAAAAANGESGVGPYGSGGGIHQNYS